MVTYASHNGCLGREACRSSYLFRRSCSSFCRTFSHPSSSFAEPCFHGQNAVNCRSLSYICRPCQSWMGGKDTATCGSDNSAPGVHHDIYDMPTGSVCNICCCHTGCRYAIAICCWPSKPADKSSLHGCKPYIAKEQGLCGKARFDASNTTHIGDDGV